MQVYKSHGNSSNINLRSILNLNKTSIHTYFMKLYTENIKVVTLI